jgi:hypothetical protein
MKRWIVWLILTPLLVIPTSAPASGVFGLGKCDKVIKQIENEIKVEMQIARDINKLIYPLNYAYKQQDEIDWQFLMVNFLNSMIKKNTVATKNANCFTPYAIADSRNAINILKNKKRLFQQALEEERYWGKGGTKWEKESLESTLQFFKDNRR